MDCKDKTNVWILQVIRKIFHMKKRKVIQVPNGAVAKIQKTLRCSRSTVYDALAGKSDSDLAAMIRKEALDAHGGVVITKVIFN